MDRSDLETSGGRCGATRREFLVQAASGAAALAVPLGMHHRAAAGDETPGPKRELPVPTAKRLPRWRGFNLLEKFTFGGNAPYQEKDFQWLARWGFDFLRARKYSHP